MVTAVGTPKKSFSMRLLSIRRDPKKQSTMAPEPGVVVEPKPKGKQSSTIKRLSKSISTKKIRKMLGKGFSRRSKKKDLKESKISQHDPTEELVTPTVGASNTDEQTNSTSVSSDSSSLNEELDTPISTPKSKVETDCNNSPLSDVKDDPESEGTISDKQTLPEMSEMETTTLTDKDKNASNGKQNACVPTDELQAIAEETVESEKNTNTSANVAVLPQATISPSSLVEQINNDAEVIKDIVDLETGGLTKAETQQEMIIEGALPDEIGLNDNDRTNLTSEHNIQSLSVLQTYGDGERLDGTNLEIEAPLLETNHERKPLINRNLFTCCFGVEGHKQGILD